MHAPHLRSCTASALGALHIPQHLCLRNLTLYKDMSTSSVSSAPYIGWTLRHYLHDYVGRVYALRHAEHIDPEARLNIAYSATFLLFISLPVIGFALEHLWHYMVLAVFSGLQTVGVMMVTTAVHAYLLDGYPEGSGEVGAWVSASRNWSGLWRRISRSSG